MLAIRSVALWISLLAVGCGDATTLNSGEGGGSQTTSGSSGVPVDERCSSDAPCAPGLYCDWIFYSCGELDGHCRAPAEHCLDDGRPVCGCDGVVYAGRCAVDAALMTTTLDGGCEVPEGRYVCGDAFCELGADFCNNSADMLFECYDLPPACVADPSCANCFPGGQFGSKCSCDPDDPRPDFTIYCE